MDACAVSRSRAAQPSAKEQKTGRFWECNSSQQWTKKTHPQAKWSRLYREAQALTCVHPPFLSTCIACCVHALQELRKHESSHLPRPLRSCSPPGRCPQQALAAPSDSRHCRTLRMLTELVAITTGRWTGMRLTRPGCRLNLRTFRACSLH